MNRNKLRGRIVEKFEKQENFAHALGITPGTLSSKLKNKAELKKNEILKWCELLEIPIEEIPSYFFAD